MPIYDSVVDTVGGTPLVRLNRIGQHLKASILVKLEARNPCGSVKDRVGLAMIRAAERDGVLKPGDTIVEATSGNTGIALAFACAALGYKLIITMPENMSRERILMLKNFGVEVVLTRGGVMSEAVDRAKEIVESNDNTVALNQFSNPANPAIHRETTAKEILEDTGGAVDVFVAGVGTGGTVSGVGAVLKEYRQEIRVVAVEPARSAVLGGQRAGPHSIQGIGAGFIPDNFNRDVVDEVIAIADEDAKSMRRRLSAEEGLFVGLSSGAAVHAAIQVAATAPNDELVIVVILPDTGERYLSMLNDS